MAVGKVGDPVNLFLQILFTLTIAGSIVTACILSLRLLPVHLLSAYWRYRLCIMAVVFYAVPASVAISSFSGLFHHAPYARLEQRSTASGLLTGGPMSGWTISSTAAYILLGIWATGVIVLGTWHIYGYHRFVKALKRTQTELQGESEAALLLTVMKEKLGIQQHVKLAYSPLLKSPVLVGLIKPTIYLPSAGASHLNINLVYHHELIHLKHKDLWIKTITLMVSALHWFNPLVHFLRQEIRMWGEFSCDEKVVQEMSIAERKRYAETILYVTAGAQSLPAQYGSSLSGEGKQLKRRLTMMFDVKKMRLTHWITATAALVAIAGISVSTATMASDHTPTVRPASSEASASKAATIPAEAQKNIADTSRPAPDMTAEAVTVPAEAWKNNADTSLPTPDVTEEAVAVPAEAQKNIADTSRPAPDMTAEAVAVPAEAQKNNADTSRPAPDMTAEAVAVPAEAQKNNADTLRPAPNATEEAVAVPAEAQKNNADTSLPTPDVTEEAVAVPAEK
ncbi:M56 family metallopeptidase [Paenibacillus silvae]|uniref:M56 family metallopeptidase n=1 Tax=Paenibacillus silvae TaxID=1325358 RepID=UPI003CF94C61